MNAMTRKLNLLSFDKERITRKTAFSALAVASACLMNGSVLAQPRLPENQTFSNVPSAYTYSVPPQAGPTTLPGVSKNTPWLLQSDIRSVQFLMKAGSALTPATPALAAGSAPDGNGKNGQEVPAPTTSMPPSMTSPLLPNVPSSLNQDKLQIPAQTGKPTVGEAITSTDQSTSEPTDTNEQTNPAAQNSSAAKEETAAQATNDLETITQSGPVLRKSFSALFTQQRPFLLYSQDASITYLMPNALVDHPSLSRYLRGILEERALDEWEKQRQAEQAILASGGAQTDQATSAEELEKRPSLIISGRVEDRFYSAQFSSLYLDETKSVDGSKQPNRILSFNFDNKSKKPIGLSDLFKAKDKKELDGTIELIDAYIQTDIVRQKSIRLGTLVRPDQDAWLKDFKPSLELLQNFTLVPSREAEKIAGLSFHFNPGVLGAEADGQYDVFVPASIFSASLSDGFAPLFGGEALRVSRHNGKGFSAASVNIEGLNSGAELGGDMLIEGEVPSNWCDGFHLTLSDKKSAQIVTEGVVQLLPDLPSYGLASNMMRFRAELSVTGDGEKEGLLTFEPYAVTVKDNHVLLREKSACDPKRPIAMPDPVRDLIAIDVNY
nr:hypothetical protein [uncultured Cohaesibacter sp.]